MNRPSRPHAAVKGIRSVTTHKDLLECTYRKLTRIICSLMSSELVVFWQHIFWNRHLAPAGPASWEPDPPHGFSGSSWSYWKKNSCGRWFLKAIISRKEIGKPMDKCRKETKRAVSCGIGRTCLRRTLTPFSTFFHTRFKRPWNLLANSRSYQNRWQG